MAFAFETTDRKAGAPAMSAYVVFIGEKTPDQGELDGYAKGAQTTVAGHEAKVLELAFYGLHEDLEGAATEGAVILEFPNMAAKAWYDSPLYRKAREHRFKGASYRVTVVEGTLSKSQAHEVDRNDSSSKQNCARDRHIARDRPRDPSRCWIET